MSRSTAGVKTPNNVFSTSSLGDPSRCNTFDEAKIAFADVECCCKYCELYVSNETSLGSKADNEVVRTGPIGAGGS